MSSEGHAFIIEDPDGTEDLVGFRFPAEVAAALESAAAALGMTAEQVLHKILDAIEDREGES